MGDASPTSPASPRRRDFAPSSLASSVWSQGGESYCEQFNTAIGSAGQDLGRFTEGPARYLNGTPNTGSKSMLEREVHLSPRGKVSHGRYTGPGQQTQIVMDRKLACKRSTVGPDPYGLCAANLWSPRPSQRAYATFLPQSDSGRQPWVYNRTATTAFDPYHVGSRNQWRHTSPSIKSIMSPPMPQTPHGSSLLPTGNRTGLTLTTSHYSRMHTAPGTGGTPASPGRSMASMDSPRLGSSNPFH